LFEASVKAVRNYKEKRNRQRRTERNLARYARWSTTPEIEKQMKIEKLIEILDREEAERQRTPRFWHKFDGEDRKGEAVVQI